MRATITRSVIVSTIKGYTIEFEEGTPKVKQVEPITVFGKVSKEKAQKELKRVYGKDSAVSVGVIEEKENQYEISVEDFVKYATLVEKAEEANENENEKAEVK